MDIEAVRSWRQTHSKILITSHCVAILLSSPLGRHGGKIINNFMYTVFELSLRYLRADGKFA